MILDELAAHARERVAADKAKISLEDMKAQAEALPKGDFRFEKALSGKECAFICEVKKASPSKGIIDPVFDFEAIAQSYEDAGADCVSCLTEPKWFLGSDEIFQKVRGIVTKPMIRKDFTVDEYQIYQAKVLGADAVLLICTLLDTETIRDYIGICDKLGMSALVETHDAQEMQSAVRAGARLIGVNNRNLKDFTVDLGNAARLREGAPAGTLKDACSAAFREWTSRIDDTHYCLGSCMGPHPFPTIVRDFQSVISREIKEQMLEKEGKLPDVVMACVGGGSNAIGAFCNFIEDEGVRLIGCEAAGRGVNTAETAATIATGRLGIFHGMKSYFCQDEYGQIAPVYSISAGLDYPGIGPEHAYLHDIGRAEYVPVTDDEAVNAFEYLSRIEGIIPAIESAHAVAYAMKLAPTMRKDQTIVINISGRGDKDCAAIARYRGEDIHE